MRITQMHYIKSHRPDGAMAGLLQVKRQRLSVSVCCSATAVNCPPNVIRATFAGLLELKDPAQVCRLRGKDLEELGLTLV